MSARQTAAGGSVARPEEENIELRPLNPNGTSIALPANPAANPAHLADPVLPDVVWRALARSPPHYVAGMDPVKVEEVRKQLRCKIDYALLLFIFIITFFIQWDHMFLGVFKQYFTEALGFTAEQYKEVAYMREAGVAIGHIPLTLTLSALDKPSIVLCLYLAGWGLIQSCLSRAISFDAVCACQFIMGILESALFYTRRELCKRIVLVIIPWPLVRTILSFEALVDGSTADLINGQLPLDTVRLLYAYYMRVSGVFAIVVAVLGCRAMPNLPRTTSIISSLEREVGIYRLSEDYGWPSPDRYENQSNTWLNSLRGLWQAVQDLKTWLLATMLLFISYSIPRLCDLSVMRYVIDTMLNGHGGAACAPFLLSCLGAIMGATFANAHDTRCWIIYSGLASCFAGGIISIFMVALGGELSRIDSVREWGIANLGLFYLPGAFSASICAYAWVLHCMPWYRPKRAACIAIVSSFASIGNVYAILNPMLEAQGLEPFLLPIACAVIATNSHIYTEPSHFCNGPHTRIYMNKTTPFATCSKFEPRKNHGYFRRADVDIS
ncbi:hypothetical protein F4677DRAFT_448730 [Hypoxylon crocopeplum]|nr:hypothetical protein F4677DRAFT_448730 [Hypoxylon crocopeplum]